MLRRFARLVSRFRRSFYFAAHSVRTSESKRTLATLLILVRLFGFDVPKRTRGEVDRNVKSAALEHFPVNLVRAVGWAKARLRAVPTRGHASLCPPYELLHPATQCHRDML